MAESPQPTDKTSKYHYIARTATAHSLALWTRQSTILPTISEMIHRVWSHKDLTEAFKSAKGYLMEAFEAHNALYDVRGPLEIDIAKKWEDEGSVDNFDDVVALSQGAGRVLLRDLWRDLLLLSYDDASQWREGLGANPYYQESTAEGVRVRRDPRVA